MLVSDIRPGSLAGNARALELFLSPEFSRNRGPLQLSSDETSENDVNRRKRMFARSFRAQRVQVYLTPIERR